MPLTPIDVQQKTFGTALRGYDLDEVDDFLDEIVTSLKDYEQRLRDAQERISTLEMEMTDRGDAEGAIARALVAAQRSADSIVADARAEAERIVGDARAEATEVEKTREAEKANAEVEISRIRGIVDGLRVQLAELSAVVGSHIDRADSAISDASATLEENDIVEAAVTEEPVAAWEQPDAESVDDEWSDADESEDDEFLDEDDESMDDDTDDEADDDTSSLPSWATDTGEETPVRPWEVG